MRVERAEAEAIYEQGREVVVRVLVELSAQNERLTAQVEALTARVAKQEERIAQLERKAKRSSRDSSQPPSQDPPGTPPRRGKDPSGRKQGAQRVMRARAGRCCRRGRWTSSSITGRARAAAAICSASESWSPTASRRAIRSRSCRRSRSGDRASLPARALPGLRRAAARRAARGHRAQLVRAALSRRRGGAVGAQPHLAPRRRRVLRAAVRLADPSGTIDAILTRVADTLEDPVADLGERVRAAAALHADETGWRTAGDRRALWGGFIARHAVLKIASDRGEERAKNLSATRARS